MTKDSKKESNDLQEKFNKLIIVARKLKANLITSETQLSSVSEENLSLMGQVTKLTQEIESLNQLILIHTNNSRKVIKIMKDPTQDIHQVAIRVANILNPVNH